MAAITMGQIKRTIELIEEKIESVQILIEALNSYKKDENSEYVKRKLAELVYYQNLRDTLKSFL